MAERIEIQEDEIEAGRVRFLEAAHKMLLASVGAVALAQDELEGFASKLIERGEIAEKDGRQLVEDIMERRRSMSDKMQADVKSRKDRVQSKMDKRVEAVLERLNVPTKADIEQLSEKINHLSQKLDTLKR